MSSGTRWWGRAAAAFTGLCLALSVPALAWAGQAPAVLAAADEVQRRRPRIRGFGGFLGALCCLVVVAVIVLAVVLMMRRRGRRPPGT